LLQSLGDIKFFRGNSKIGGEGSDGDRLLLLSVDFFFMVLKLFVSIVKQLSWSLLLLEVVVVVLFVVALFIDSSSFTSF
jgi:hypothetical protein